MKKKFAAFILAAACITGCAVGLTACNNGGGTTSNEPPSGEQTDKEQVAKALNAFVKYFEPEQPTAQALYLQVNGENEASAYAQSADITMDDILKEELDPTTAEGINRLSLPLTYSYLLAKMCENDNFVLNGKPVQFKATVGPTTMNMIVDFAYDTAKNKLTYELQVIDMFGPGISPLIRCEISYNPSTDTVGDFTIHGNKIGGGGNSGSSGSGGSSMYYTYLSIEKRGDTLKEVQTLYYPDSGEAVTEGAGENAAAYGAYHCGLLDGYLNEFNERAAEKEVINTDFAAEFAAAGEYIGRLQSGAGRRWKQRQLRYDIIYKKRGAIPFGEAPRRVKYNRNKP